MREVATRLYVGDQADAEKLLTNHELQRGWVIVHACKEPYHRAALGYVGRAAPKDDPEYLVARRFNNGPADLDCNRLILNMIDAADPQYIPMALFEAAIPFIADARRRGKKVLVHCNQGRSRGPGVAMAFLASVGQLSHHFDDAEREFKVAYPDFEPAEGVLEFLRENWMQFFDLDTPMAAEQ